MTGKRFRRPRRQLVPDDGSGTRLIALTRGLFARVDAADYARLILHNWSAFPVPTSGTFYAARGSRTKGEPYRNIFMHQEVMGASAACRVDHKNHDGLDNRRENLRECDRPQNMRNRRKLTAKTSAFKGVHRRKARAGWIAKIASGPIMQNGKRKQVALGTFGSELAAAAAYDQAARETFGEFAVTNGV